MICSPYIGNTDGRSVGNLAHAHFCAQFFNMPLKGAHNPSSDAYTPRELSNALFHLFGYVFLDLEPTESFRNRVVAARESQRMGSIMAKAVSDAKYNVISRFMHAFGRNGTGAASSGPQLVKRLLRGGKSVDEVVWTIIPTAAAACATQAQGVSSPYPSIYLMFADDESGRKCSSSIYRISMPRAGPLSENWHAPTNRKHSRN